MNKYEEAALKAAEKSPCKKRKVGCCIVSKDSGQHFIGWNHSSIGDVCEDENGNTLSSVVHAEVMALSLCKTAQQVPHKVYVTFKPCADCMFALTSAGVHPDNVHVVEEFIKYDTMKPAMGLLPKVALQFVDPITYTHKFLKALHSISVRGNPELERLADNMLELATISDVALILAYGARKYKPNNWRYVDDITRYWSALGRHLFAMDKGEHIDEESKLPHAAHALTNILFILELTATEEHAKASIDS
jgi:deoxycytidylate deaminase